MALRWPPCRTEENWNIELHYEGRSAWKESLLNSFALELRESRKPGNPREREAVFAGAVRTTIWSVHSLAIPTTVNFCPDLKVTFAAKCAPKSVRSWPIQPDATQ